MIVRLYNQPTRVPSNEDEHKRFHWVSIFAGYSSLWLFQCRRSTAFIHPNLPLPHGVARRSLLMYLNHAGYVDFRATYIRRAWCLHTFHVARGLSNITHLNSSLPVFDVEVVYILQVNWSFQHYKHSHQDYRRRTEHKMIWYKPGLSTQLAITATCFSAFLLYVNAEYCGPCQTFWFDPNADSDMIRVSLEVYTPTTVPSEPQGWQGTGLITNENFLATFKNPSTSFLSIIGMWLLHDFLQSWESVLTWNQSLFTISAVWSEHSLMSLLENGLVDEKSFGRPCFWLL